MNGTRRPTVVVLHAHPDDEAIFTGATISRLTREGARVVLVTATTGGAGVPRIPLAVGESLQRRRTRELEAAAEALGVARLVLLGHEDSGAHAGPWARASLGAQRAEDVGLRLASVLAEEEAGALVHYDRRGIYGHVDHVQVHRAGAHAIGLLARLGQAVTGYEATVDPVALRRGPRHVLAQAAGEDLEVGTPLAGIDLTVEADLAGLAAKYAAMAAHQSQIGPEYLDPARFPGAYGREWFVRRGEPVLEGLLLGEARLVA